MLVLTRNYQPRNTKYNESTRKRIFIKDKTTAKEFWITVLEIKDHQVKLGIKANSDFEIVRGELLK